MNKQSNSYTIAYIIILVLVVGSALALTNLALRPLQKENADADKMRQILASVHIAAPDGDIVNTFDKYITHQFVINDQGERIGDNAFAVNVSDEVKKPDAGRRMPVYECTLPDNKTVKYILPVYGAGLWGPIWGYVAVDDDGSTIYGAYFAHQGETPGLGAEIEKPAFSDQFTDKHLFKDGQFIPVNVLKAGQKPLKGEDYVDAVSGGTITSKGVAAMLGNCLAPYQSFLASLRTNQ